jgi:hypothetical protein
VIVKLRNRVEFDFQIKLVVSTCENCCFIHYYLFTVLTVANYQNLEVEYRYSNRGSAYLFAPMVEFNIMSEVGDTPP